MRSNIRRAFVTGLTVLSGAAGTGLEAATPKPPTSWRPAYYGNYSKIYYTRSIRRIVIHTIEGTFEGGISWMQTPGVRASSHYIVNHNGAVAQLVADNDMAWHVRDYNGSTIGIENAGWAGRNMWTTTQYRTLAQLTAYLCERYGIPKTRTYIVSHQQLDPSRRYDPGPYFNWTYFLSLVNGGSWTSSGTTTTTTTSGSGGLLRINTGPLNVRTGPGTGYGIIGTLPAGQIYVASSSSSGWYKIWYDHRTGWVSGGLVSRISGESSVVVNTDGLNVRTGPGTGYGVAGTVSRGMQFYWLQYTGLNGYYKIYWRGGTYYIYGNSVYRKSY